MFVDDLEKYDRERALDRNSMSTFSQRSRIAENVEEKAGKRLKRIRAQRNNEASRFVISVRENIANGGQFRTK